MISDDLGLRVKTLCEWFEKNRSRLRREESATVADELAGQLLRIDGRLGVEVGEGLESDREVILTAFSDPDAFSLVHSIVDSLSAQDGWRFVALKPPRGFAFKISWDKGDGSAVSMATVLISPAPIASRRVLRPSMSIASCRQSRIVSFTNG